MEIRKIKGYKNRNINAYIEIEYNSEEIFILYPGLNYGYNHPFFYYLKILFSELKKDYIFFDYNWSKQNELFSLTQEETISEIKKEIISSFKIIEKYNNRDVIFLGKSLGSTALEVAKENKLNISKYFWITPFKNTQNLLNLELTFEKDIIYVGENDRYYNSEIYKKLEKKASVRKFKEAGHSFEIKNNAKKSIEILEKVLLKIKQDIEETINFK